MFNNPLDQAEFIEQSPDVFSTQNDQLLHILEDLQSELPVHSNPCSCEESRIRGYFCFDTIFNLGNRVLSENELKIFKKI